MDRPRVFAEVKTHYNSMKILFRLQNEINKLNLN